eukprot:scaffold1138_cov128-Cylindrotheca_fusiformis.AAC.40
MSLKASLREQSVCVEEKLETLFGLELSLRGDATLAVLLVFSNKQYFLSIARAKNLNVDVTRAGILCRLCTEPDV